MSNTNFNKKFNLTPATINPTTSAIDKAIIDKIANINMDDVFTGLLWHEPKKRESITVHNQKELDAISNNFDGDITIDCEDDRSVIIKNNYRWATKIEVIKNSRVVVQACKEVNLRGNSCAIAQKDSFINAYEKSFVSANGQSCVNAYDDAVVEADDYSRVYAHGDATVVAKHRVDVEASDDSHILLYDKACCFAYDDSVIEAADLSIVYTNESNCVVDAYGEATVIRDSGDSKVTVHGNARIIERDNKSNDNIYSFMDKHGVKYGKTYATFYKAVRKTEEGKYVSDWDDEFEYKIGEYATEECDDNIYEDCSNGLHVAPLDWVVYYGKAWSNLAILEVKVRIDSIVLPLRSTGKVRTNKLKVIREVPLEECGPYGVVLAKRHKLMV